ncbi:2OG-Fe(II) oxygenase [Brevundimonas sp.]|uniref:2OG-Fe(II) oxygenase n=1 Tax=Brevundimonas sp. TaxID=1871086 RepID=UPI00391A2AE9
MTDDSARALHAALTDEALVWRRSLDNPANVDVPVAIFESQPADEQARLIAMVHEGARDGFQYVYDRIRIGYGVSTGEAMPEALAALYTLFNNDLWLDFARTLTGDDRIARVDAMATRFGPGQFLNGHNDQHEQAGRLYAYVLNLCPRWRAEWGGLLLFKDDRGEVVEAFTPGFNVLNVFRVPQTHAVSMVTPFAGAPRLSITGWWRSHA